MNPKMIMKIVLDNNSNLLLKPKFKPLLYQLGKAEEKLKRLQDLPGRMPQREEEQKLMKK